VGEDAAALVMGSLLFLEFPIGQASALDASMFAHYLAGPQAVGWGGEPKLARLGYTIAATLAGIRMLCLDLQRINDDMPSTMTCHQR
jgi:hypothetical protein